MMAFISDAWYWLLHALEIVGIVLGSMLAAWLLITLVFERTLVDPKMDTQFSFSDAGYYAAPVMCCLASVASLSSLFFVSAWYLIGIGNCSPG
jgi:hypothetical protein